MQRRHYKLIASILYSLQPLSGHPDHWTWRKTCEAFATRFADEYPNFDRQKFLDACHGEEEN